MQSVVQQRSRPYSHAGCRNPEKPLYRHLVRWKHGKKASPAYARHAASALTARIFGVSIHYTLQISPQRGQHRNGEQCGIDTPSPVLHRTKDILGESGFMPRQPARIACPLWTRSPSLSLQAPRGKQRVYVFPSPLALALSHALSSTGTDRSPLLGGPMNKHQPRGGSLVYLLHVRPQPARVSSAPGKPQARLDPSSGGRLLSHVKRCFLPLIGRRTGKRSSPPGAPGMEWGASREVERSDRRWPLRQSRVPGGAGREPVGSARIRVHMPRLGGRGGGKGGPQMREHGHDYERYGCREGAATGKRYIWGHGQKNEKKKKRVRTLARMASARHFVIPLGGPPA